MAALSSSRCRPAQHLPRPSGSCATGLRGGGAAIRGRSTGRRPGRGRTSRRPRAQASVRGEHARVLGARRGAGRFQDPAAPGAGGCPRRPGGRRASAARPAQQPGLAARARAQVEPEAVRAGRPDPGQRERGQLAGLVLHGRLAAGDQGRRVAAGQPVAVRRPAGALAVGQGASGRVRLAGGSGPGRARPPAGRAGRRGRPRAGRRRPARASSVSAAAGRARRGTRRRSSAGWL